MNATLRGRVLLLVALLGLIGGAGLFMWSNQPAQEKIPSLESRTVETNDEPELVGNALPRQGAPLAPPIAPRPRFRLRVIDEAEREPVPRASVVLVSGDDLLIEARLIRQDAVLARGVTDDSGSWESDWPTVEHGTAPFICVQKSGYRTPCVAVGDATELLEVALKRGLEIEGRVTDSTGEPVPGVNVRAREISAPSSTHGIELESVCSPAQVSASTLPDGTFTLAGLRPSMYRLSLVGGDWILWEPPPRMRSSVQMTMFEAGAADVRLTAECVRGFRIRFLDGSTASRVRARREEVQFAAIEPSGARVTAWREGDGQLTRLGIQARDASEHVALMCFREPQAEATEAEVFVSVPGYQRGRTHVELLALNELRDGARATEITLRPVVEFDETCSLLLTDTTSDSRFWIPPRRALMIWPEHGGFLELEGDRQGQEGWLFRGVPRGRVAVISADSLMRSVKTTIDLHAGLNRKSLTYEESAYITLEMRDGGDHRIFDADSLRLVARDGPGESSPVAPHLAEPAWDSARSAFLPKRFAVDPGNYKISAHKYGYGWSSAEFVAKTGETTSVTLRFDADTPQPGPHTGAGSR